VTCTSDETTFMYFAAYEYDMDNTGIYIVWHETHKRFRCSLLSKLFQHLDQTSDEPRAVRLAAVRHVARNGGHSEQKVSLIWKSFNFSDQRTIHLNIIAIISWGCTCHSDNLQ